MMASVTGIYFGLEESVLLEMRTTVLATLQAAREGKRFQSVSGGGKAFSKENMSIEELRNDLAEISAALKRIDPVTYGKRVTRFVVSFSGTVR